MITFRTSTEITADRRVVLVLPPETPLGKAELVVTVSPAEIVLAGVVPQVTTRSQLGTLRRHFGTIHGGDPRAADNERIDADLARAYGESHD